MRLLVLLCAVLALAAEDTAADRIGARARGFEQRLDQAFAPVAGRLDGWLRQRRAAAAADLARLLPGRTRDDRLFLAWHALHLDPGQREAAAVFAEAGVPGPVDGQGRWLVAAPRPACANAALVEQVLGIVHPSFQDVVGVVRRDAPETAAYWRELSPALQSLSGALEGFRGADQPLAMTMLAYYWPEAKPVRAYAKTHQAPSRQRWWANHVDQWLLDHELAGIDCLTTKPVAGPAPTTAGDRRSGGPMSWRFPELLRRCRVEAVVGLPVRLAVLDGRGRGVSLAVDAAGWRALAMPAGTLLATGPTATGAALLPVLMELRDGRVVVAVGGADSASAALPAGAAFAKLAVETPWQARLLRVRFLGEAPALQIAALAAPAPEPWRAERDRQMLNRITTDFSDTSVEEVVDFLGKVVGAPVVLAPSAAPLKDLPVSLRAQNMTLADVFFTLERLTQLTAAPTATGFELRWR